MVFQQKLLEKAYFIVKTTGPAMVRLGSFSNLGCLNAPAVFPTIAVADPGEGPGGARPHPSYLKVWIRHCIGWEHAWRLSQWSGRPVLTFGKRPEQSFCYFFVADH